MTRRSDYSWACHDGLFVSIYANTKLAEIELGRFMESNGGSNKVLLPHWPAIKADLRSKGWTIRKEPKSTMSTDQLLAELDEVEELIKTKQRG
jgi:hypothetical protein